MRNAVAAFGSSPLIRMQSEAENGECGKHRSISSATVRPHGDSGTGIGGLAVTGCLSELCGSSFWPLACMRPKRRLTGDELCSICVHFRQGRRDASVSPRITGAGNALAGELVALFLEARFSGAERHQRRMAKVASLENTEAVS